MTAVRIETLVPMDTCNGAGYNLLMIRRFRHRGLRRLYETDDARGAQAAHADRLRRILTNLDVAMRPADLDLPGYRLHRLKGERTGVWSVTVSGNWRVTFRFDGQDVTDVNCEDYHCEGGA